MYYPYEHKVTPLILLKDVCVRPIKIILYVSMCTTPELLVSVGKEIELELLDMN